MSAAAEAEGSSGRGTNPATGPDGGDGAAAASKDKKGRSKGDTLYYRVKCRDNGVGMPHEKARHIFYAFGSSVVREGSGARKPILH